MEGHCPRALWEAWQIHPHRMGNKGLQESMKSSYEKFVNPETLRRQLRDGWLPIPESVIPPQRDKNFLWRTLPEPKPLNKTFLEVLQDSISKNFKDVEGKVGLWLSGGIDSSTALVLLCEELGSDRVVAYHLDCGYQDELERATMMADFADVKLVRDEFTLDDHLKLLPEAVLNLRMPTDLTTQNIHIAKMCLEDGIKTACCALGLDELQGGYYEHVRAANEEEFRKVEAHALERARSHMAWFEVTNAPGLDVKLPFLEQDTVAYGRAIPRSLKCQGTQTKLLIRELMKDKMPRQIVEAGREVGTKRGFLPLIEEWWSQGLGHWVEEMIPLIPDFVEKPKARSVYRTKIAGAWRHPTLLYSYLRKMATRKVRIDYWIKHRLATVPIFLDHLEKGKYGLSS